METPEPLLQVRDLSVSFTQYAGGLSTRTVQAVSAIELTIGESEIVAVVGASGSGKSLLAHAILGILPANAAVTGSIAYRGSPLTDSRRRQLLGREISFIPQSVNYLDPLMKVGAQVRIGLPAASARSAQQDLFRRYGLNPESADLYPFQLSGGMLRRVMFATSVREDIRLVIADEPTPGIHPEALAEILAHLKAIARSGAGVMLITHDLISATAIADRIAVIRDGRTVAIEAVSAFSGDGSSLGHPYSQRLWRALPQNDFAAG